MIEHDIRSEELQRSPFAEPELREFSRRLQTDLRQVPKELVSALKDIPRNANTACFSRWISSTSALLVDSAPKSRDGLERFLESALGEDVQGAKKRLRDWRKSSFSGGESKALSDEWQSLLVTTSPALLQLIEGLEKLRPRLLEAAMETLAPLLAEVERRLHANGVVSYEDLLSRTRDLLRANPTVRGILRREIDQILVDEFQDTNQMQCEIIRQLALNGPAEDRPGLFLVGDPKQSIYGWRGADLSAYDRFVSELEGQGLKRRRLSVNFRSVPGILDEVNRSIAPIMQAHEELQPPYQSLLPSAANANARGYASERRRPIEHWVSSLPTREGRESMTRAETTELEARALAVDLRELQEEVGPSFQWSSVGLLFRSTSDLETYLTELRRAHVPYSVERDRHYFRRREILDATALLAAVVEPADHLSLLAFLRSAWVGVPDAALLGLWQRGFPHDMTRLRGPEPELIEKLTSAARDTARQLAGETGSWQRIEGWEECLCLSIRQLASLRESLRVDRPETFLKKLRQWTQVEARDGSRYLGLYRVANLERFFRQLRDALCSGRDDARGFLSKLRRGIAEGLQTQDAQLQVGSRDAVRVMTIHKAKGLDFTHLYLLQCHKNPPPPHNAWKGTKIPQPQEGLQILLMGYPSLGYALAKDRAERVEGFERVRLLYVALTRAKRRLVVAGGRSLSFEGPSERAQSFSELLASRAHAAQLELRTEGSLATEADFFLESVGRGRVAVAALAGRGTLSRLGAAYDFGAGLAPLRRGVRGWKTTSDATRGRAPASGPSVPSRRLEPRGVGTLMAARPGRA